MWERVMFQAECDPEGTGWCQVRDCDPADCPCYGPTQEGLEYKEEGGVLYARPAVNERLRMALEKVLPHVGRIVNFRAQDEMVDAVKFALTVLEELDVKKEDPLSDLG